MWIGDEHFEEYVLMKLINGLVNIDMIDKNNSWYVDSNDWWLNIEIDGWILRI